MSYKIYAQTKAGLVEVAKFTVPSGGNSVRHLAWAFLVKNPGYIGVKLFAAKLRAVNGKVTEEPVLELDREDPFER